MHAMKITAAGLAALHTVPAFASGLEDLGRLDARIAAAAGLSGAAVSPLDRRLRLIACPQEPSISAVSGYIEVGCLAIGWRLRIPVSNLVTSTQSAEIVIRRGDPVELVSKGDGFAISASGIAQNDAAAGAVVRVKTSTAAMVKAVATAGGTAELAR